MKLSRIVFIVVVLLALVRNVPGQSFLDLNFEFATITPDPSSPYYPNAVYASNAIRGWTATGFLSPSDILYNDISLGATSVSLVGSNDDFGPNSLDRAYSIDLYGGVEGPAAGASISQTGLVPLNAASIRFIAQGVAPPAGGSLLVTLGGQIIALSTISTGPNYSTYGGDISAFAGEIEQLTFTAPQGVNNYWEIDDIQFSVNPIPEPRTCAVLLCGVAMFGMKCWRRGMKEQAPISNVGFLKGFVYKRVTHYACRQVFSPSPTSCHSQSNHCANTFTR